MLLRVLKANPRYFTDGSGKAVYLTGSHNWNNLVDIHVFESFKCLKAPRPPLDYTAHLRRLKRLGHNFFRLWRMELTKYKHPNPACSTEFDVEPHPWLRTGPGRALDGRPRFDLARPDPAYFRRMRSRVMAAGRQGIYVSIMLFEGYGVYWIKGSWANHPFNGGNNVNGVDGDENGDGRGLEIHTLSDRAVNRVQEAYVRKVIDTVGDLDNVLYEIANESHGFSTRWQYHMIDLIKRYEARRRKRHPVGMTYQADGGSNEILFKSKADWVSPSSEAYLIDPPLADGKKVSIPDTDHHCGVCGDATVIWKNFARGHNPIYMDPMDRDATRRGARLAMGDTRRYARRMNLAAMRPQYDVCSTAYCLARHGFEYLAYQPTSGPITVDLSNTRRKFSVEWFDPVRRATSGGATVSGGAPRTLTPPFPGQAVLYLEAAG